MQELSLKGCTVGIAHISGGILFFKNRDLAREYCINNIYVIQSTPKIYTLKGVNLQTKELEGVSIGVNKYKVCVANTHVVSTPDIAYDILCGTLLNKVKEKNDVPKVVRGFVRDNTLQGGRILVSSPKWSYLIEVFKKEYKIKEIKGDFVITNRFSLISYKSAGLKPPQESCTRLKTANRMIKKISSIKGLKGMLRSHVPQKGKMSVCRHGKRNATESSHIIQIQGEHISWSSLVGYPCENDYNTIQLFQK